MRVISRRIASRLYDWSGRRLGYGNPDPARNGEYVLLEQLPAAPVVFDVGAHHGDYTLKLLTVRPQATVHCFEPSAVSQETLVERVAGRATVHGCALGASTGTATLYADQAGSEMASLLQRDLSMFGLTFGPAETVQVTTVDAICELHGVPEIELLKIDTEGAEANVIAGARRMIEADAIALIVFEYGGTALDSHRFVRDFYRLLQDKFDLYRLLSRGLLPLGGYRESYERAEYVNMVAVRR